MARVWCVRANGGIYTERWVTNGFAGVHFGIQQDLSGIQSKDQLYGVVQANRADLSSPIVIGNIVGQIGRFLLDIQAGDYVVTPSVDTEWLNYGQMTDDPSYYYTDANDGVPHPHRRKVAWSERRLNRSEFSVPFQNTIRSSLTVFAISQHEEFLSRIGLIPPPRTTTYDPYRVVIGQILALDAAEFEILVGHLLTALGFEGSEVTGKPGDGGVDAIGELNVSNLAKVKIFVQAKRYKVGSRVSLRIVRQLRQAIPFGGQGAFITTADFQANATEVAIETGFPRIGLINGRQLVDLLIQHWVSIPLEFRERLGLKPGLVLL